jgi:hypothetical protein
MITKIYPEQRIQCCNTHLQCVGSLDGKEFIYADGSRDKGRTRILRTIGYQGVVGLLAAIKIMEDTGVPISCWDSDAKVVVGVCDDLGE